MPRPSNERALVRNRNGSVKSVRRERLPQMQDLGWSEVTEPSAKKRAASPAAESTPAVVPDNDSQEG